jgi:hypothetical protein
VRTVRASSEDEMVARFLRGELSSPRWGGAVAAALAAAGLDASVVIRPDLDHRGEKAARRSLLATTRGYGEDGDVFEDWPAGVRWEWAMLDADDLAAVRYIEYPYWNELSGGSRLAADAAARIGGGVVVFDVPNDRFEEAADALASGASFPPLILAGESRDRLVCLEGNLRLTAYALAGFPAEVECLVGIATDLARWAP